MRTLHLHAPLAACGARFETRHGAEIASVVSDTDTEYRYVRDSVGVTDFSWTRRYRVPEETGIDFLDSVVAGNVARLRFGRVLHTCILDDNGYVAADCYVANNDDELILICESLLEDGELDALLESRGGKEAGLESLDDSYVALSVDGFRAWAVLKELLGPDVLGLPYLSIEMYPFEGENIKLVRAGKTSEFGYLLLAPLAVAPALLDALVGLARSQGGGVCGCEVHHTLRLEGRFFNLFAEGVAVRDPLVLGLQWMFDFDKESFCGSSAVYQRRQQGLTGKIIGISSAPREGDLAVDATLYDEEQEVGRVVASCYSRVLDRTIGLAVLSLDYAWSGLTLMMGAPAGHKISTISMPPIMPKSLGVKLDEM